MSFHGTPDSPCKNRPVSFVASLLLALACAVITGCAYPWSPPPLLVLDNKGGYSHAGRRLELYPEGNYKETRYTDAVGDAKKSRGTYALDSERTHLTLSPSEGKTEHLYRVDLDGHKYWVREEYKKHIQADDGLARQVSLRESLPKSRNPVSR
jgi:hypothetical protein